jgi:hypothetical protein
VPAPGPARLLAIGDFGTEVTRRYSSPYGVALAPTGPEDKFGASITGLRQTYSRRHAFKDELTKDLHNFGVRSVP